jgi:hypothetical protein
MVKVDGPVQPPPICPTPGPIAYEELAPLSTLEGAMFNVLRKGPVRAALNMLLKPRGI